MSYCPNSTHLFLHVSQYPADEFLKNHLQLESNLLVNNIPLNHSRSDDYGFIIWALVCDNQKPICQL